MQKLRSVQQSEVDLMFQMRVRLYPILSSLLLLLLLLRLAWIALLVLLLLLEELQCCWARRSPHARKTVEKRPLTDAMKVPRGKRPLPVVRVCCHHVVFRRTPSVAQLSAMFAVSMRREVADLVIDFAMRTVEAAFVLLICASSVSPME